MNKDYYTNIPRPLLLQIASELSLGELNQQCRTSQAMVELCRDNDFWYAKLRKDYPNGTGVRNKFSWIDAYLNKLQKELTEDQAQREYLRKYGNDIDFRSRYVDNFERAMRYIGQLIDDIQYCGGDKYKRRTEELVSIIIGDPNIQHALFTLPHLSWKQEIEKAFERVLGNTMPKRNRDLVQKTYNDLFVNR